MGSTTEITTDRLCVCFEFLFESSEILVGWSSMDFGEDGVLEVGGGVVNVMVRAFMVLTMFRRAKALGVVKSF